MVIGLIISPHLNQIFCEDVVDVLEPRRVGVEVGQVPDPHRVVELRGVSPLLSRQREVGEADLELEDVEHLRPRERGVGAEVRGHVDHVLVVGLQIENNMDVDY